jgi:hypothetical protein
MAVSSSSSTIDTLSGFCRRELAAVESYRQGLSSLPAGAHTTVLATCLRSHEERAELFKSRLRSLQAEPPSSAGILGAFVKALESAAAAISLRVAIAALKEEEDRLTRHYRAHLIETDLESQRLMDRDVVPAQLETQRLIHAERSRAARA